MSNGSRLKLRVIVKTVFINYIPIKMNLDLKMLIAVVFLLYEIQFVTYIGHFQPSSGNPRCMLNFNMLCFVVYPLLLNFKAVYNNNIKHGLQHAVRI